MHRYTVAGFATLLMTLMAISSACRVEINTGKLPPSIHGDPSFGRVVLATRIDPVSKEPLDDVDQFDVKASTINATINVKNLPAGGTFRFQWKKGERDAGAIVLTVPVDLVDNWVAATVEPDGAIDPGDDWSVDVLLDGALVSSKTFAITAAPPRTRSPGVHPST
jgi:hypothetical protein